MNQYGKHCDTIIVTNEVASFSEDIIKKYNKDESISIIIAPNKNEQDKIIVHKMDNKTRGDQKMLSRK